MRRVVLILGPPGAGKTTTARTLGLEVYDRDDPRWDGDEARFRAALKRVGSDPRAQAVVIRTGSTAAARHQVREWCRPTETHVMATPEDVCIARVKQRGRGHVGQQVDAIRLWWTNHKAMESEAVAIGHTSRQW